MTMAVFTQQAIKRADLTYRTTAGADVNAGDVVPLADGRVGIVAGVEAVPNGGDMALYINGVFEVVSASATTITASAPVYWDDTNNVAVATPGDTCYYMGRAHAAKTNGQTSVTVDLNVCPASIGLATVLISGAGAPTNGTTGANVAGPGSLYTDITNGVLYINTNTKASPTWTKVGTQT